MLFKEQNPLEAMWNNTSLWAYHAADTDTPHQNGYNSEFFFIKIVGFFELSFQEDFAVKLIQICNGYQV
jgi:hypothetical protein